MVALMSEGLKQYIVVWHVLVLFWDTVHSDNESDKKLLQPELPNGLYAKLSLNRVVFTQSAFAMLATPAIPMLLQLQMHHH